MSDIAAKLNQKSVVLIFAYAPAGFGHLRVADALYHGLPKGVTPLLLGSQDKSITGLHRFLSIHPIARDIFEWAQKGAQEYIMTWLYRWYLRSQTKLLYQQMITILEERIDVPSTVIVVATHFGLAHQLATIKERLMQEKKIRIILVLQVTDDSPQYIWYVPGVDIAFVPSERTKRKLIEYGKKIRLPEVNFQVIPYPISPVFSEALTPHEYQSRTHQVDPESKSTIHVSVPVSGAAVGMRFFITLMDRLYANSNRFTFHAVSKLTVYTQFFLNELLDREHVDLYVSSHDRAVVNKYEDLYKKEIISLEITKPSEQAFKALSKPTQRGGSVLLFAEPVGRQEYENLDFLQRHRLLPSLTQQKQLWEMAENNTLLVKGEHEKLFHEAATWRAVIIPGNSIKAANFIWWCFKNKLFSVMMQSQSEAYKTDTHADEVSPEGVKRFWRQVTNYLTEVGL